MDEKEAKKKKPRSFRNEKLKLNRASETEERRQERLRIRHEKDRARRNTKARLELCSPHNVSTFYPSIKPMVESSPGLLVTIMLRELQAVFCHD